MMKMKEKNMFTYLSSKEIRNSSGRKRFHVHLVLTSTFSILKEDKPFEKKIADRAWDMTFVWTMVGYQM